MIYFIQTLIAFDLSTVEQNDEISQQQGSYRYESDLEETEYSWAQ